MRSYRQYARDLAPAWLRRNVGARMRDAMALLVDVYCETVYEAGAANLLGAPSFPDDALPRIGSERMIERYPGETHEGYKARLRDAWKAWSQAGTYAAILRQLSGLGLTAILKENWDWNWDNDPANWSRFWVVVTGHPWVRRSWGDGSRWGRQALWGAKSPTGSLIDARALRRLIRKWKPAHVSCPYVIVVMESGAWAAQQPNGTWNNPANRNPAALYATVSLV